MRIYRVEHIDTKRGPFYSTCLDERFKEFHSLSLNKPNPYNDNGIGWAFKEGLHSLGCESKEQLKQWFGEFVKLLETHNYIVRIFEVGEYIHGVFQIAFVRHNATMIEEHLLTEYFA